MWEKKKPQPTEECEIIIQELQRCGKNQESSVKE